MQKPKGREYSSSILAVVNLVDKKFLRPPLVTCKYVFFSIDSRITLRIQGICDMLALVRVLFKPAVAFEQVKGRGKPVGKRLYETVSCFCRESLSTTIKSSASELSGSLADLLYECKPIFK